MTRLQLVDIRSASNFQKAYLAGSINLNLKNFEKYSTSLLSQDQPIQLVYDSETADDAKTLLSKDAFSWADSHIDIEETQDEILSFNVIPASEFLELEDNYILLDVRHPDEITRPAPEKNLVNIDLSSLPGSLDQLDKSLHIYTLCGSGNRGTTAASYLKTLGYKASVVQGGIKAINEA